MLQELSSNVLVQSLSGLIGRGLSADSHNPESKPALIAHKHVEPKEHKGDEARKTDHKKAEHGEKFSEDKDRGLAVNLGMNMGMCANVIVSCSDYSFEMHSTLHTRPRRSMAFSLRTAQLATPNRRTASTATIITTTTVMVRRLATGSPRVIQTNRRTMMHNAITPLSI